MAGTVTFQRFERLFNRHVSKAEPDGWQGAGEVLKIALPHGYKLLRVNFNGQLWYELFTEGDTVFEISSVLEPKPGDRHILEAVLTENGV